MKTLKAVLYCFHLEWIFKIHIRKDLKCSQSYVFNKPQFSSLIKHSNTGYCDLFTSCGRYSCSCSSVTLLLCYNFCFSRLTKDINLVTWLLHLTGIFICKQTLNGWYYLSLQRYLQIFEGKKFIAFSKSK